MAALEAHQPLLALIPWIGSILTIFSFLRATSGVYGLPGAMLGTTVHALAKALLFASAAAPEADGEVLTDARGLASRYPLSAVGFVVGALAVVGDPPTLGYAAHWRISRQPPLTVVPCSRPRLQGPC
jgi:formate hydrogenlyase subunit 3/multisubunit Na+/H+ antiporter MnhD subunit